MPKTGWAELSTLVLCDVLAGLPMRQLVRLQRLGQPRLASLCSLAWVTGRMTEVRFSTVLEAYLHGEDFRAFCNENVLKRLNGHVEIVDSRLEYPRYPDAYATLVNKVPGKLHLHLNCIELTYRQKLLLLALFDCIKKQVLYITRCSWDPCHLSFSLEKILTSFVIYYFCAHHEDQYSMRWSAHSLNGRSAVDVLRAAVPASDMAEDVLAMFRHCTAPPTEACSVRPVGFVSEIPGYYPGPLPSRYDLHVGRIYTRWKRIPLVDMTKIKSVHRFKFPKQFYRDEERRCNFY